MHVPEAGNDVHALRVDDLPARPARRRGRSDARDAVSVDDDRRPRWSAPLETSTTVALVIVRVCAERRGLVSATVSRRNLE